MAVIGGFRPDPKILETFPRVFCFPKSRINKNGGKTRSAFLFASPRQFDFFIWETETSECFKFMCKTFQVLRHSDVICKKGQQKLTNKR